MKLLECNICQGELDIIGEDGICKLIKCQKCGFTSNKEKNKKSISQPEVVIRRKRN